MGGHVGCSNRPDSHRGPHSGDGLDERFPPSVAPAILPSPVGFAPRRITLAAPGSAARRTMASASDMGGSVSGTVSLTRRSLGSTTAAVSACRTKQRRELLSHSHKRVAALCVRKKQKLSFPYVYVCDGAYSSLCMRTVSKGGRWTINSPNDPAAHFELSLR